MQKVYTNAGQLVGNTPLLRLEAIERELSLDVKLFAKLEYFNPSGSVKDRAAVFMLDDAESRGLLAKGSVIIEPTSGNTGIGLASQAAARGYRAIIVMPDTMSEERRRLMRAYGAELLLTDGALGMSGAIESARQLAANTPNSFIPSQFDNPANPAAHEAHTGPEIWRDTDGEVDMLVCGVGTGGTVSGTGRYLKAQKPSIKVVAVEPEASPVLSEGRAGKHGIQGIGAGFVPAALDTSVHDRIVTVSDADAIDMARRVARKAGVLVGISSGAALAAAVQLSREPSHSGMTIVAVCPDSGERYLSAGLYD